MKHANNCGRRALSALLALLTCLPLMTGISLTTAAADDFKYSDDFNVSLDFDDLAVDTTVNAAYVNGKLNSSLFVSSADSDGSYAPTKWKAVADPADANNTAIGLINTDSYAMFRIVDKKNSLYEKPAAIDFRIMLNESVGANTTLVGWAGSTSKRTRVLGLSGNKVYYGDGQNDNRGGSIVLSLGKWHDFRLVVEPKTGHVQVYFDGSLTYDFIQQYIRDTKPSYSAINICYGWGSDFNFNAYLDDISIRSLDAEALKAEAEEKAREQERRRAEYVMPSLEKYCKAFTYLEDDGVIGIPAGLTAYYKGEQTHADTSVVFYIMGYVGAREVGKGDTLSLLNEFLYSESLILAACLVKVAVERELLDVGEEILLEISCRYIIIGAQESKEILEHSACSTRCRNEL